MFDSDFESEAFKEIVHEWEDYEDEQALKEEVGFFNDEDEEEEVNAEGYILVGVPISSFHQSIPQLSREEIYQDVLLNLEKKK